jgi:hypothetical protein
VIVVPATPPLELPDAAGAVQAARVPAARAPSDSRLTRRALAVRSLIGTPYVR